jgi:DNA-binding MarR family transcriptional regulator
MRSGGQDHVDWVMSQWQAERPDLDVSPQGLVGRLHRVGLRLTEELLAVYAQHGLGEGEFDVLATLRRSGPPYALTPGELGAASMVSSGAISKRVDRCEARGWVSRRPSEDDGRSRVVALTKAGRELIDRAFEAHMANEHRLVAALTERQREQLAQLLRTWARALDA